MGRSAGARLCPRPFLGEEAIKREEADLLSTLPCPPFPGGRLLRWPALVAGMSWYALRDRFG